MHELRYFQEIHALSKDVELLWLLKCRYIVQSLFRYPEGLKIYFDGREEWLFDYLPSKSEASKILAEALLPTFLVHSAQKRRKR